jgi:hypothetical protein
VGIFILNSYDINSKKIIPFILFIGIGTIGAFSVETILREKPMAMTLKWCGVPTLIFAIYFAYRASFGYPKKVPVWQNNIGMLTMTAVCCMLFFMAFQGILILINCNIGQQKDYQVQGKITKIESTKSKNGRISYSLWLDRQIENDTVKIEMPYSNFSEGDFFSKKMKEGSLGFIYSNQ